MKNLSIEKKEKILGQIVDSLDEVMDLVHEINFTDELESLYCKIRDMRDEFENMIDPD